MQSSMMREGARVSVTCPSLSRDIDYFKGRELKQRFWDLLAFTRVVSWGREFRDVSLYFAKNLLEGLGFSRAGYALKPLPE